MSTKQRIEGVPYIPKEWETVACPFCNASKYSTHERYGDTWQYTYVKCRQCGLIYQNPRPKYDSSFVHDAYEYYAEDVLKNLPDPQKYLKEASAQTQCDDCVAEILKYDTQGSCILDVGSYTGIFLHSALKRYPKAYGVDVSTRMAKFIENQIGVKVFLEKYEDIQTDERFSCIHMSHVIEHIPNPKAWLEQSKKLLTGGGVLVISVPNGLAFTCRIKIFLKKIGLRKGHWEPWRTPDHLYEPTVRSMIWFLRENGFEVLNYKTYSSKKKVDNSLWERLIHQKFYGGTNLRIVAKLKS
ncbi:MAG: class I SAM-dependent methyltransferase [Prevotellaceae bacterium]|jgi:2-polyprenyl-3-methyl-5-hydroxy-6-metoxy-1,4-benzoquinol methylase|nr:class I SAM-dependent methyltransferase [Prevotellaceae bacterium]